MAGREVAAGSGRPGRTHGGPTARRIPFPC